MAKIFQSKYAGQDIEQLLDKTSEKQSLLDNLSETEEGLHYKNQAIKDAIGLSNVNNTSDADKPISKAQQEALDKKVPDTRTVNGKPLSEDVILSSSDVGADEKGTASTAVSTHNTATDSHNDIRLLITELTNRLNALANSDDTTLDQMNELVAYIKANRGLIEGVTTSKVNVTDIINNLTTNSSDKVLSAAQGVAIKSLIEALQETVNTHTEDTDIHITSTERTNWNDANNKKHSHSNKSVLDGITSALITSWNNAVAHITDTVKHITSDERTLWNTVSGKVDKVTGKGLSTNDFTDTLKTKLEGIAEKANNYIHPASGITAGTYRSVTVDKNGHVTGGTNPTTLASYGITDAETKGTTSTHNTSTTAHNDIRELISGLTTRLNTLANSDDTTLDQMSEVVAYIKNNKTLIEGITTNKVNITDIINNLTTNVSNKPLSAAQGVVLKGLIDTLQEIVNALDAVKHSHSNSNVLNNTTASYTTEEQEQVKAIPDVYQKKTIEVIKGLGEWTAGSGASGFLTGVCYGNGRFVAVGTTTYYSKDGITWTAGSGGSSSFSSVCYGNGKFVAVDGSSGTYYSKDGITWTAGGSGASGFLTGVCYGNGRFVAVGTTTYYSKDGITWTAGSGGSSSFSSVCYGNGKFVAVDGSSGTYYSEFIKEQHNLEDVINELYELLT